MKTTLFPVEKKRRRVLMHVEDAGPDAVKFRCRKCGHETEWQEICSAAWGKRGIPCPKCNTEGT